MDTINNIYVERIAYTARKMLIENKVISEEMMQYDENTIQAIIEFFGGQLELKNDQINDSVKKINEDYSFCITLKKDGSRELFIRALHELGHAFLHLPSMEVGEPCFYDGNDSSDIEAELFVRSFMMPFDRFEEIAKKCIEDGMFNVQKVAEHCKMDYVDTLVRGKELKYWE